MRKLRGAERRSGETGGVHLLDTPETISTAIAHVSVFEVIALHLFEFA